MAHTFIEAKENIYTLQGVTEKLYDLYDHSDGCFEYTPDTAISSNQVYKISNFSEHSFCLDILKHELSTTDYNEYKAEYDKQILINVEGDIYYFQRITTASLKPKRFLRVLPDGNMYDFSEKGSTITIFDHADAIYSKDTDVLYFLKFDNIKAIFLGIIALYRDATKREISDFLSQDFIQTAEGFNGDSVQVNNRKRIAALRDKYNAYNNSQRNDLKKYIQGYDLGLRFEDGKFLISSDADLKKLIYGIDQRYYTTPIDNEKRIANSVINIGRAK